MNSAGFTLGAAAIFSDDRQYRYALTRAWPAGAGAVMFVGLNPSTADETVNDPTIRRCMAFAKMWGYSAMVMTNLFAYRATDPLVMKKAPDPVGPENDKYLELFSEHTSMVVAAWGAHGAYMQRDKAVRALIKERLFCLGMTKDLQPKHPLYLPKDAVRILYLT